MTDQPIWFITGAAGFIGSNLAAHLLRDGQRVVGYDNFLTGKRADIDRLAAPGGSAFSFVEGDILDGERLARALAGATTLVHLAAQVSVQRSLDDPIETNEINVTGFLRVLQAAAEAGVRRLLYASSCAVYGDNPDLPLAESSRTAPPSPYAASKLINEHYALSLGARHPGMGIVGFRFFNIFGPFQDHQGGYAAVIPRWISLMMDGGRPVMFGDGAATRDFCCVDNVCALLHRVGGGDTRPARGVYNVGTGETTTLAELYRVIRDRLAARGIAVPHDSPLKEPWRTGDIVHSYADIARARDELGYAATVTLGAGIDRILDQEYGTRVGPGKDGE